MELPKNGIPRSGVMEPVRGGQLATLSEEATAKLTATNRMKKYRRGAFRFLQAIPEVTMTLSGMSNMQQLKRTTLQLMRKTSR
ncbi:MAG: hypothetical protein V8R46_08400 [Eubacterium ramulus]